MTRWRKFLCWLLGHNYVVIWFVGRGYYGTSDMTQGSASTWCPRCDDRGQYDW